MINVKELKQENRTINDLSKVLHHLIEDEQLRSNPVFCELMERFNKNVEAHLSHEDRSVYSNLLNNEDRHIHNMADQFMTNTHELRRLMKDFVKRWCNSKNDNGEHAAFVDSTREIFNLVDRRIDLENSMLFPAIAE